MMLLFPEIYRYLKTDLKYKRLLVTFVTISIASVALILAAFDTGKGDHFDSIIKGLLYAQYAVLIIYGASQTASSIADEKRERTWEFQLLTPLTGFRMAVGKLIGATLFSWYCWLLLLLYALVALALGSFTKFELFLDLQLSYLAVAFAAHTFGLLISAYTPSSGSGGRLGGVIGVILFIMALGFFGQLPKGEAPISYLYGLEVSHETPTIIYLIGLGICAIFSSIWKIGADFLEPRRFWRFPLGVGCIAALTFGYLNSFPKQDSNLSDFFTVAITGALVASAAFLNPCRSEHWGYWLGRRLTFFDRLNSTPVWISGWISAMGVAVVIAANGTYTGPLGLISLICFLGRDLVFLQIYRLGDSRRPELAVGLLALLVYLVPVVVLNLLNLKNFNLIFVPQNKSAFDFVPPLVEMILLTILLAWRSSKFRTHA